MVCYCYPPAIGRTKERNALMSFTIWMERKFCKARSGNGNIPSGNFACQYQKRWRMGSWQRHGRKSRGKVVRSMEEQSRGTCEQVTNILKAGSTMDAMLTFSHSLPTNIYPCAEYIIRLHSDSLWRQIVGRLRHTGSKKRRCRAGRGAPVS